MTKSFAPTLSRTASWMAGASAVLTAAVAFAPACVVAQEVGKAAAVNPAAQSRGASGARTIVIGQSIAHRERIQTTSAGSVQLLFIDKTSMTIGPNSDLAIDEYVFDPATNTGKMAATLTKGVMRFVGGQVSHQGNAQVTTPNAVVGIRGGVAIISPNNVFIGYGEGNVSSGSGSVTLGAGDFTQTMGSGIAPTPPTPPPPNFVQQQVATFQSGAGQGGGARASTAQVNTARTAATGTSGGSIATAGAAATVNTVQQSAATSQGSQSSTSSAVTQTVQTSTQTTAAVVTANEIQQQPPPNNNPPDNPPPNNPPIENPPPNNPPPNDPPPNNNPFPVNGAFAFGMTNCCSLTSPVSNAPYVPASFAAGSNTYTSLMLGHISSAGGPDSAVTLQYGFGVSGGANANQSSWFFVATGGIFVDGETAILGGGFGGTRRNSGAGFPTVAYGSFSTPANAFTSTDPSVVATVNNNEYVPEKKTFQTVPSYTLGDLSQPTAYTFTQRFAPATIQPTGLGSNRPTVYLTAYAAGMMQSTTSPAGGTPVTGSPFAVSGTGYVSLDATSGRLQADFSVNSTAGATNASSFNASYLTGLISTSDRPQSAYIDYENFGSREYVSTNSTTGQVTQNSTVKGQTPTRAMIAVANVPRAVAQQIATGAGAAGQTVCNCDYTRWGFWSADTTRAGNGAGPVRESGHMMTWVAGQRPDVGEVPATGSASYAGHIVANVNNNGNQYLAAGNLQNTINFASRTGSASVTGFDGTSYSGSMSLAQNDPRDISASLQSATGGRTMTMTGSLFRAPTNPVGEMGGSVLVNGANYGASGIFAASKVP